MARIRSIKPEFWTSEQIMELSRDARLLFIGLWTFCDDGGNHPASAKTLKAEVFPGDDDATVSRVMQWIDEMIEAQLLTEYEVDGKEFWHVTGWRHQRIDQPTLRHPAGGDAGDTGDAGDARHLRHQKRLGGKQRQLLLRKLRERDGDACHFCGDASSLTIIRVTSESTENPQEIAGFRLICPSCKRQNRAGDAEVTQGDSSVTRRCLDGDSPLESSRVESRGVDLKPSIPSNVNVDPTREALADHVPTTAIEWAKFFASEHGIEIDTYTVQGRSKLWPLATGWIDAGISIGHMRAAIAKAKEDATEPIMNLPAYVDRVLQNEQLAKVTKPKPVPLHAMTDVQLNEAAHSVGLELRPGWSRPECISRIQTAQAAKQGRAVA
ncbi:hypothetical protein BJN34_12880 [Cupriavidus necator]|uniref:Uncharacterized protein n=1 Tax=Cupriavidus necator TaxID=106590 RepID=A0A1U9URL4_CUPNE|nr:hypothetical protein [Cupriavidus necator]AQV94775.1 hypothetical protein BJN34_12880 [Cupriavidus necator]